MKTCFVVPYYLRTARDEYMLKRLIDSAAIQVQPFAAIIAVDDASPNLLNCSRENIIYIRIGTNSGPAKARNAGMEKALELGCSHILFSDHDCVLSRDWSLKMTSFMARTSAQAVGGFTLALGQTLIDKFHDANGTLNGRYILPERKRLLYAPTCNFAISREVAELFQFDTKYRKAAGEDVDYCLRIGRIFPIGFCEEAVVYHDFGYKNAVSGMPRLVNMFEKYKEANALLYASFTEYFSNSWFDSEPIYLKSKK